MDFAFPAGETVVVTGAGSGIGRATALLAAAAGLRVAAWDVQDRAVAGTADEIVAGGGAALALTVDVADPAAVRAALAASGPARYLVNNAGPASSTDLDFDRALALTVGSVRTVTDAWLAGRPGAGAAVVNVASVAGNLVGTDSAWYCAGKAAIAGYTRHLATRLAPAVRANAVAPGLIDTPVPPASPPPTSAATSSPATRWGAPAGRRRSPTRCSSCSRRSPAISTASCCRSTAAGRSLSEEEPMPEAVIVAAARSPIGRAGKGSLVGMRADDLVTEITGAALAQVPALDPRTLDDVLLGCAQPAGEQGYNLARILALRLGLDEVPGTVVQRYCASSVQTTRMALHAIRAGRGTPSSPPAWRWSPATTGGRPTACPAPTTPATPPPSSAPPP